MRDEERMKPASNAKIGDHEPNARQEATRPAWLGKRQTKKKQGRKRDAPAAVRAGTHSAPALAHKVQGPGAPVTRLHFFFCCRQRSH